MQVDLLVAFVYRHGIAELYTVDLYYKVIEEAE
jgi:hypothetical protein